MGQAAVRGALLATVALGVWVTPKIYKVTPAGRHAAAATRKERAAALKKEENAAIQGWLAKHPGLKIELAGDRPPYAKDGLLVSPEPLRAENGPGGYSYTLSEERFHEAHDRQESEGQDAADPSAKPSLFQTLESLAGHDEDRKFANPTYLRVILPQSAKDGNLVADSYCNDAGDGTVRCNISTPEKVINFARRNQARDELQYRLEPIREP